LRDGLGDGLNVGWVEGRSVGSRVGGAVVGTLVGCSSSVVGLPIVDESDVGREVGLLDDRRAGRLVGTSSVAAVGDSVG
jgi:hypothetical protein